MADTQPYGENFGEAAEDSGEEAGTWTALQWSGI